jgi:hypothetical protein
MRPRSSRRLAFPDFGAWLSPQLEPPSGHLPSCLRRESPSLTIKGYIRDSPVTAPEAQAKIREGAAKAGLIEAGTN